MLFLCILNLKAFYNKIKKKKSQFLQDKVLYILFYMEAHGVMVTVVGNGYSKMSPRLGYLYFT